MALKRSLVWDYFTCLTKDLATCNACGREVSTGTGSTSGLANHLKTHHVSEYEELQEKKLAKSPPSELMASTPNVDEHNEDYDDAGGSGWKSTNPSLKIEFSANQFPKSSPKDAQHDSDPSVIVKRSRAELTEVSSLLSLAMPTANVNLLVDEDMEDEAVAIEVRPKVRLFKAHGIPQAKWSVVILWLPSGTICVYVLKMDRRIMECKKFQPSQTLEVVEYVKTHTFINTRWEMCPGASDVVPSLSTFWEGCDSGEFIDYGTNCELLVPAQDENDMPTQCKFCEPVGSGTMMEEVKNAFKEEEADIDDSFGPEDIYSVAHEVKVKLEEPEDYLDTALPEGSDEGAFMKEDNLGYFESTNSFHSVKNLSAEGNPLKRSKRSFAWDYFTCITKELASCNTCNREIPTGGGSTSGLANHLRSHHKPMYHEMQKKKHQVPQKQSSLSGASETNLSPSEAGQNLQIDILIEKGNIKVEGHDNKAPRIGMESKKSIIWDYFMKKHESLVSCNTCNKDIKYSGTTSNLAKHLHIHHKPLYVELQRKRQIALSSRKPSSLTRKQPKTDTYKYKCESCQMPFKTHKKWARHMQRHKGEPGVMIPAVPAGKIKTQIPMKPWMCDLCGAVTKYRTRHMASVHKVFIGDKYPCDICGRVFWQKCELKKHVRTHIEGKSFICSICGKTFKCMQGRQYCEERCSGNNQKYECSTCGRKFQIKNRLICHMRTHTGERPYACPIPMCNSSYMSSTNLGTHIKQTHKMNPREVRAKMVKQQSWHEARGVNPA